MGANGVACHELLGNLQRKSFVEPALDVNPGQFALLACTILLNLFAFTSDVGPL